MAETAQIPVRRRARKLPLTLAALAAIGAAKAGLWFYFRRRQPLTDGCTRERLQPRASASS